MLQECIVLGWGVRELKDGDINIRVSTTVAGPPPLFSSISCIKITFTQNEHKMELIGGYGRPSDLRVLQFESMKIFHRLTKGPVFKKIIQLVPDLIKIPKIPVGSSKKTRVFSDEAWTPISRIP